MKKILVADDDAELRANLVEVLKGAGYAAETVGTAKELLAKLEAAEFDVVLLDVMMPKMTGMEALPAVKRLRPNVKVIMLTAFATIENAVEAMRKGASDYIAKPFKIPEFMTTIRRVLEEAKFETCASSPDLDALLNALASPIRRQIIKLLQAKKKMRLMEMTRELKIEDHTKVVFHLKILKEAKVVEQDEEKVYSLNTQGVKTLQCLKTLEEYLRA